MDKPKLQRTTTPSLTRCQAKSHPPEPPAPLGNAERDSLVEMEEVHTGFRDRARREQQRYWDAVDSEYWCCVCFQTRAQKEEFLQKAGWAALGDKYLDGLQVARALGIAITAPSPPKPRLRLDPKLVALVGEE